MNDPKGFDFTVFPVLTTERLVLRELRFEDAPDVLIFRGDPVVQRFNGPVYQSVEEAEACIKRAHEEYATEAGITWAVTLRDSAIVVGMFSFHHWSKRHRRAEVGYDLGRAYWGQGIASEALRAIIRFGFERMNLNYIYAGTIADNHESVRLLERLGFQREGTRRQFSWEDDGQFHDSAMYGLLQDELVLKCDVIEGLEQVSVEWLTVVLTASGALTGGAVDAFDLDTGSGNWSKNVRLRLRYTADARGDRPRRLFLKMVNTDLDDEFFGPSEVTYYTRDYAGVADAPLLRCYDARYSEVERRYHLLLDDVSETHVVVGEKEPTLGYGRALAEGLAVLHAHWWGADRLAEAEAPIHSPEHIRRFVAIAEPGAGHIIKHFSGEMKVHWPALIRDLFANHPQAMIERTQDDNGFTLIHGDVGPGNVLIPEEGDRPLYIIDRQPFDWSVTSWVGVYDLAYAIVLDWPVELRRAYERPILERYHEELIRRGVQGYPWEQLWDDYRLTAAMGVYIAVEYCRGGINERWQAYWWQMLQRALKACDDLRCSEMWT